MSTAEICSKTTSLRIPDRIIRKLDENYPNVNRSLMLTNVLDYILLQDPKIMASFCVKNQ